MLSGGLARLEAQIPDLHSIIIKQHSPAVQPEVPNTARCIRVGDRILG